MAPVGLQWRRVSAFHLESDRGHRIARMRVGDRVRYSAFEVPLAIDAFMKGVHIAYPIGATIPQQRRLIDVFPTVEEAKQACETPL